MMMSEKNKKEEAIDASHVSEEKGKDKELVSQKDPENKEGESPEIDGEDVDKIIEMAEMKYKELTELREICKEFPELESLDGLAALEEREKYEKLREKGFSVRRAFLASNADMLFKSPSKSHMAPMLTRRQESPLSMSSEEYAVIKAVFGDSMSDERIAELYKRIRK